MSYVVLDDDPTGTQAVHDVPVLLRWDEAELRGLDGERAVHLMTNVRAMSAVDAERVTAHASRVAREALPRSRMILRGDSTLRGHLLSEYHAVIDTWFGRRPPVLLLVPALPAAGRVTVGGIHWVQRGDRRIPVHQTEYAADGVFSYHSSRLLEWAEERTDGELRAADGIEVSLDDVRSSHGMAIADAIAQSAAGSPAAVVADATEVNDLELIANGARHAWETGAPLLVRCAPAFAGVLAGTLATDFASPPPGDDGVIVVCGSYVRNTTEQLSELCRRRGHDPVVVDVSILASDNDETVEAELTRAATLLDAQLSRDGLAVVSTPRERPFATQNLKAGERIASGLASVLPRLRRAPRVVIAKGGITSQVTLAKGLGSHRAQVVGPVIPGVALWSTESTRGPVDYLVFPGNVGGPDALASLVDLIDPRPNRSSAGNSEVTLANSRTDWHDPPET